MPHSADHSCALWPQPGLRFSQAVPGVPYEGICQVPPAPLNDALISGCQGNSSLGVLVLTVSSLYKGWNSISRCPAPLLITHFPTSPCQQAKLRLIRAMRLALASSVPPQVLGTDHQSTVYQCCLAPEESPSPFLCPASSCLETRTEAESILGFIFIPLPGLEKQAVVCFMQKPLYSGGLP